MVVQAILEIVFMLLVAAFIGYKAGRLLNMRQTRNLRFTLKKKEQKVEELQFDLNQCVRVRRRLHHQIFNLQKELETRPMASAAVVNDKGTVVAPPPEASKKEEVADKKG